MDSHLTHERPGELIEEFDREWAAGGTPRLEAYLARAPEADRSALFAELLAVELTRRMQRGEDPDRDDYLHRFPEYAAAVEGLLETRGAHPGDAPPTTRTLVLGPGGSGRDAGAGDTVRTPEVPPERVGRYRLERVLGRGGFGVVWLARDPELGRKVAVKVPRPDRPCPPEALENFLREARRAATLKVRGIVPVYDIGVEGGRFFIVSEYMEGGTLAERMRRGKMPPAEAARLIASVAETLHQAHLGNVVHRDIKPGNILLDARGEPYVGDLGLAVTEAELLREPGIPLGTYAYMSPEQFRGETDRIDPRSDVYSLGVVLYQLLTGRLPFLAEQPGEYETQTLRRDPRPPRTIDDTIPPELERVCLKCLAKARE
ncbi:MAG TPA: serine/threonine-protein kinase, partial [Gemmataceae bacterium]